VFVEVPSSRADASKRHVRDSFTVGDSLSKRLALL
jgi:hypothetical protein